MYISYFVGILFDLLLPIVYLKSKRANKNAGIYLIIFKSVPPCPTASDHLFQLSLQFEVVTMTESLNKHSSSCRSKISWENTNASIVYNCLKNHINL